MDLVCAAPITRGPSAGQSATGTAAGSRRHYREGEPPCDPCRRANSENTLRWQIENREKHRAKGQRWTKAHPEHASDYYARNREAQLAYQRQYRTDNADAVRQVVREWTRANPQAVLENSRRYKLRKRGATIVRFTAAQLDHRMSMFGYRCWMCGGPFEHVDHVKPLSKGGAHCLANLRPACASCNVVKSDKWPLTELLR